MMMVVVVVMVIEAQAYNISLYIFLCIYLQEPFFMIAVIINIMSWRHTFLANAQYMLMEGKHTQRHSEVQTRHTHTHIGSTSK